MKEQPYCENCARYKGLYSQKGLDPYTKKPRELWWQECSRDGEGKRPWRLYGWSRAHFGGYGYNCFVAKSADRREHEVQYELF